MLRIFEADAPIDPNGPVSGKRKARMVIGEQLIGGRKYEQDPEHFGNEQMRHLQPDRSQQDYIHCPNRNLSGQDDGKQEHPWRAPLLSPETLEQAQNIDGTDHCGDRVEYPQTQHNVTA